MPIISHVQAHKYSTTLKVLTATVKCPSCRKQKKYELTLRKLRNVTDDYVIHREDGAITWVEGTTRLLKCPSCGAKTIIHYGVAKNGSVIIGKIDEELMYDWWKPQITPEDT